MSKVLVVADLHADHWRAKKQDPLADVPLEDVDVLILAGDIANKGHVQWRLAIEALSDRISPEKIYLMPGNHDYYGGRIDREDKLRDTAERAGANFIQKDVLVFGDTRFLCCTLWTDMRLGDAPAESNMTRADGRMNDHRSIRVQGEGFRKFSALHAARLHRDHLSWLEAQLAKPFEGKTVVVTHHAPHPDCIHADDWKDVPFCYASDLSGIIETFQPSRWVHGHTHVPTDFKVGHTRVTNASIGYPEPRSAGREIAEFSNALIEVVHEESHPSLG